MLLREEHGEDLFGTLVHPLNVVHKENNGMMRGKDMARWKFLQATLNLTNADSLFAVTAAADAVAAGRGCPRCQFVSLSSSVKADRLEMVEDKM